MIIHIVSVYTLILVFVRTETLFLAVPVLGGSSIPVQARVALGFIVSVLILPISPAAALPGTDAVSLLLGMLYEFLVGLTMGIAVNAVISTISFAAETIVNEIGLMRMETLNPMTSDSGEGGGISTLMFFFGLMVFLAMGMHREVILALAESFRALPAGCMNTSGLSVEAVIEVTKQIFVVGLLMSAPFIAIAFLVNMVFALLGKIAQKMNVFILSFSVKILAGVALLATSLTLLEHYMEVEFSMIPSRMFQLILGR
jgi:flagellar biosynthesis protein FliR